MNVAARGVSVDSPVPEADRSAYGAESPFSPGIVGKERAPILLVDDNPANLMTFETILAELGEPIVTARSGEEALRKLLPDDFAVIVLDVNMPGMTGFETASLIRQRLRTQHTPIIFVSAISTDEAHAYRGYSIGGVDYIFAPIVAEVLRTKVRVFVDLYKQRRAVHRQAELLRELQERQHRQALSETSEKLRLALNAGRMGVWELDLASQRIAWSRMPGGLAGVDPGTEWETLERFFAAMSAEDAESVRTAIETSRRAGSDLQVEPRLNSGGEGPIWIEIRARFQPNAPDLRERFVGVFLDITERKLVEEQLRRARDEATQANQAKDRFLATLSHELRTPLTPALMAARGWLGRPGVPEELERDLRLIGNAIETESRLIDDLLDLTNISRDTMTVSRREVELHEIISTALQLAADSLGRSELCPLKMDFNAHETRLHGDPIRLKQVVWNLIANAYKFSPEGGSITIRTYNPSPGYVTLEVQDHGIGIESRYLERIFDAFEKAPTNGRRSYGGLGLGLSICRKIAELHEGVIEASSEGAGRGASFRMTLPLAPSSVETPAETRSKEPSAIGLRILLVEDHASTADVMSRLLSLNGHRVQTASTVESGFKMATSNKFDLLISDVGLPDGTGLDLLRRLRPMMKTPAIALTGYGRKDDIANATSAGFAAHLTKPVDLDELTAVINRVVQPPSIARP